jgi:hypothetical protein
VPTTSCRTSGPSSKTPRPRSGDETSDATEIVASLGGPGARRATPEELLPLVYDELRFFGGLTTAETAEALGVSPRTVEGDWAHGRAWLKRELSLHE